MMTLIQWTFRRNDRNAWSVSCVKSPRRMPALKWSPHWGRSFQVRHEYVKFCYAFCNTVVVVVFWQWAWFVKSMILDEWSTYKYVSTYLCTVDIFVNFLLLIDWLRDWKRISIDCHKTGCILNTCNTIRQGFTHLCIDATMLVHTITNGGSKIKANIEQRQKHITGGHIKTL